MKASAFSSYTLFSLQIRISVAEFAVTCRFGLHGIHWLLCQEFDDPGMLLVGHDYAHSPGGFGRLFFLFGDFLLNLLRVDVVVGGV